MPDREAGTDKKNETGKRLPGGHVRLEPAGEARVKTLETPVEPPADKQIHQRRPLPLVPEGPADDKEEDQ